MSFAGINYLAIVVAAVVAWLAGAAWYGALAKPWVAAQGATMEEFAAKFEAQKGTPTAYVPYILSFVAELIMAWVLAGLIGHLGVGQVTLRNGVISGLFAWIGFVVTTMAVNNAFGGRKVMLTVIDAGHWLVVLVIIGAIIGAMGV
jgi:uncharacterized protein DUF1761